MAFQFHTPSSILVVGPSGSGKTVFVTRLLQQTNALFKQPPDNICYCYGAWQEGFKALQQQGVTFYEGIPDLAQLKKWFPKGGVLCLDDLMDEGGNDKRVLDLFTKHSHHNNVTVLYLSQDMFPPGKYAKTINRNAHYIIVFKNPRDQLGFKNLLIQSFPDTWKDILKQFQKLTQTPFTYMVVDLHPASDDAFRLYSHILKEDGWTHVYRKHDIV